AVEFERAADRHGPFAKRGDAGGGHGRPGEDLESGGQIGHRGQSDLPGTDGEREIAGHLAPQSKILDRDSRRWAGEDEGPVQRCLKNSGERARQENRVEVIRAAQYLYRPGGGYTNGSAIEGRIDLVTQVARCSYPEGTLIDQEVP